MDDLVRFSCEDNHDGNRVFVMAILEQAYKDMFCAERRPRECAFRFIDPSNDLFRYYCELLGYSPSYMASMILGRHEERMDISKVKKKPNPIVWLMGKSAEFIMGG